MDTLRDIQDRLMKLVLSRPRMVRDLLALLPAEWTAAVDASGLREMPTEFIGAGGEKRIADLCWLAEGRGSDSAIILIENQSTPDWRMPARATTRVGLLYESLGASVRRSDGKFPPVLIVVVYTGDRPWRMPDDLSGIVHVPASHPLSVPVGPRYARLDLRDPAAQYPEQGNRMAALARLMFAESNVDAIRLLGEVRGWLDFGDEDEARLFQCYLDWFHANVPEFRPRDWNPERERKLEELMAEQSILQRNNERWLQRHRQELLEEGRREAVAEGRRDGLAEGRRKGLAEGRVEGRRKGLAEGRVEGRRKGLAEGRVEGRREALVRLAARRFGAGTGRRLAARLRAVEDPGRLDRVGDLVVDSETGEQLLGAIKRAGLNSS